LRLFQQRAGRAAVPTPSATRALYQALMDRDEPEQAAAALEQAIKKLRALSPSPLGGEGLGVRGDTPADPMGSPPPSGPPPPPKTRPAPPPRGEGRTPAPREPRPLPAPRPPP